MENEFLKNRFHVTRRHFLGKMSLGLGSVALGSLLIPDLLKREKMVFLNSPDFHISPRKPSVSFILFQNGAPSQLESFDYKPLLNKMTGQELPASIRMGQRLTGMTSGQAKFPLVGSHFHFKQYGQSGAWVSELFPHTAKIVDESVSLRRCIRKPSTMILH